MATDPPDASTFTVANVPAVITFMYSPFGTCVTSVAAEAGAPGRSKSAKLRSAIPTTTRPDDPNALVTEVVTTAPLASVVVLWPFKTARATDRTGFEPSSG